MSNSDHDLPPDDLPSDSELRALYRQLPAEEPRAEIDDAILAAARRAVGAKPVVAGNSNAAPRRWSTRWPVPVAAAASVLLAITVLRDQDPREEALPAAMRADVARQEVSRQEAARQEVMREIRQRPQRQQQPAASEPAAAAPASPPAVVAVGPDERTAIKEERMRDAAGTLAKRAPAKADDISPLASADQSFRDEPASGAGTAPAVAAPAPAPALAPTLAAQATDNVVARSAAMDAEADRRTPAKKMAAARENAALRAPDWPFAVEPGATITGGPLDGLTLLSRTAGPDETTTFLVRGDGLSATALAERVDGHLRAGGWQALPPCGHDVALHYLRAAEEVRLLATGADRLAVRIGALQGCK